MERNRAILSAFLISGVVGLAVPSGWPQTKGTDGSGSTPRGSSAQKKDESAAPSGGAMKSTDAMRDKDKQPGEQAASGSWNKEDVKKVQEALKDKGNDPGPADGILGPQTQKALRAFQSKEGLKSTGRLDAETAKALGVERGSAMKDSSSMGSGTTGSTSRESRSKDASGAKNKEPASR